MSDIAQIKAELTFPLEGKYIRLQKLNPEEDYQELWENCTGTPEKEAVMKYMNAEAYPQPFELETFREYLANDAKNNPDWIPFVVIDKKSNRKIGRLNMMNMVLVHKRGEIGFIWYASEFHGTYANPEGSLLSLYYIFENLKFRRAEWKLNSDNIPSAKAAEKIGFVYEGRFRQHQLINGISQKDVNKDLTWYSMLDSEWEAAKQKLFKRLGYTKEDEDNLLKYRKD
jgi:RimJ/RimL family protein N-acetyltransferase